MKLYNTLTRNKEEFIPLKDKEVRMYACGLTVYNFAHIGNLRAYLFEDVLRRVLEFHGYKVIHGMNVTDVGHLVSDADEGEDKMEVGAQREGRHPLEIAREYETKFFDDLKDLRVELPDKVVRATESISEQISIINILEEKGFTYKDESAIYFDTSKLPDYGKLSGQKLEDKMTGAREEVVVDQRKRNPQDFVLWFFLTGRYKNHVLHWPSPWGEGFPGWHIECSAISRSILGQPFDIHTGGVDHIGTHHTNEIAQSEAAFGEPLARYWVHGEHLLVDGQKMSKSLGNVYALEDLKKRGYSPLDFRYLVLGAHYRSRLNFTWEALESAKNSFSRAKRILESSEGGGAVAQRYLDSFGIAISDDLDTPKALAIFWELLRDENLPLADKLATALEMDRVFGLGLGEIKAQQVPAEISDLVEKREEARRNKNYELSDKLRDEIENKGWRVEDKQEGYKIVKI
ncbi:MAG: cysteine--tRNA ligase [Patescibacteria group bacterium]|jgi:cysteinyl-tRNA synthetase